MSSAVSATAETVSKTTSFSTDSLKSIATNASASGAAASVSLFKTTKDSVKYSPLDAGVLVEGGKVIGQNSFKVAGQVIIGISAAFLVWDAIDLGFTISDLVRKQGSHAAKVLREKAQTLEFALQETAAEFCLDMPE